MSDLPARVAAVTDADLALTRPVDADTYMDVLAARAARATTDPRTPALLEWMVRDDDVPHVTVPDDTPRPAPKREPRPFVPRDVASLTARRDRLVAEQEAVAGTSGVPDRAATRLRPKTARRVQERADEALARYAALDEQITRLNARIADWTAYNERGDGSRVPRIGARRG